MDIRPKKREGHCLCGAITFSATPVAEEVGVCHCGMCRRWSAGPFMGVNVGDSLIIDDETATGVFQSSPWGERVFCKDCGSTLFWRSRFSPMSVVAVGAFDPVPAYSLVREVFIDEKPETYAFAGETTKLTGAELMALFAPKQD